MSIGFQFKSSTLDNSLVSEYGAFIFTIPGVQANLNRVAFEFASLPFSKSYKIVQTGTADPEHESSEEEEPTQTAEPTPVTEQKPVQEEKKINYQSVDFEDVD